MTDHDLDELHQKRVEFMRAAANFKITLNDLDVDVRQMQNLTTIEKALDTINRAMGGVIASLMEELHPDGTE